MEPRLLHHDWGHDQPLPVGGIGNEPRHPVVAGRCPHGAKVWRRVDLGNFRPLGLMCVFDAPSQGNALGGSGSRQRFRRYGCCQNEKLPTTDRRHKLPAKKTSVEQSKASAPTKGGARMSVVELQLLKEVEKLTRKVRVAEKNAKKTADQYSLLEGKFDLLSSDLSKVLKVMAFLTIERIPELEYNILELKNIIGQVHSRFSDLRDLPLPEIKSNTRDSVARILDDGLNPVGWQVGNPR
jgi:hypothetical protein